MQTRNVESWQPGDAVPADGRYFLFSANPPTTTTMQGSRVVTHAKPPAEAGPHSFRRGDIFPTVAGYGADARWIKMS